MTTWDRIYKKYQKGGPAWATLSEDIHPKFVEFFTKAEFPIKNALDVGVGTGKYLTFLEATGFSATGIDSSPTAIELSKKVLSSKAQLHMADMFTFKYPKNTFDLIISISTLHHGYKNQVQETLSLIYQSLVPNGNIFITLPDITSAQKWNTFKSHTFLTDGTFAPNNGPETGLAHSFFREDEIRNIFKQFNQLKLELDEKGRWLITGLK